MTDEETAKTGELLLSLAGKHSIIVIEHDMVFVRQIARKVTVLHQGTVLCEGTVDQVQSNERVIEVYLGAAKSKRECSTISNLGMTVSIGGSRILRGLNLEVPPNRLVCLMGRNGVGKSTTLKTIVGLLKPNAGSIRFAAIATSSPSSPRPAPMPGSPTSRRAATFSPTSPSRRTSASASWPRPQSQRPDDPRPGPLPRAQGDAGRKGGVLSGGQQQQLAIARALAHRAQAPHPGRADRGHSALHHRPHRRHPLKIKKEAGISILLVEQYLDFCLGPRRQFLHHGSRRAGSTYYQRQEFYLQPGAGLVLLDWFCSGRSARRERWAFTRLQSRNEVFHGQERLLTDSLLLDQAHGPLDGANRMGRFNCLALLVMIGPMVADAAARMLAEVEALPVTRRAELIISASPIRQGAVLRIAGESGEEVGREIRGRLAFVSELLGDDPWARKW
jgi:ABC-type branched-subunit amino acid transport system ATPase component